MPAKQPFNEYRVEGDVAYLILTDRQGNPKAEFKLDLPDLRALEAAGDRWCLRTNGYVFRNIRNIQGIYLHRLLMGAADGMHVDHINRDPLDNRRENLREVSPMENQQNRTVRADSSSRVRGVIPRKSRPFPYVVRLGSPAVFTLKVRTLNIGRITASLARAQHWGAEAA